KLPVSNLGKESFQHEQYESTGQQHKVAGATATAGTAEKIMLIKTGAKQVIRFGTSEVERTNNFASDTGVEELVSRIGEKGTVIFVPDATTRAEVVDAIKTAQAQGRFSGREIREIKGDTLRESNGENGEPIKGADSILNYENEVGPGRYIVVAEQRATRQIGFSGDVDAIVYRAEKWAGEDLVHTVHRTKRNAGEKGDVTLIVNEAEADRVIDATKKSIILLEDFGYEGAKELRVKLENVNTDIFERLKLATDINQISKLSENARHNAGTVISEAFSSRILEEIVRVTSDRTDLKILEDTKAKSRAGFYDRTAPELVDHALSGQEAVETMTKHTLESAIRMWEDALSSKEGGRGLSGETRNRVEQNLSFARDRLSNLSREFLEVEASRDGLNRPPESRGTRNKSEYDAVIAVAKEIGKDILPARIVDSLSDYPQQLLGARQLPSQARDLLGGDAVDRDKAFLDAPSNALTVGPNGRLSTLRGLPFAQLVSEVQNLSANDLQALRAVGIIDVPEPVVTVNSVGLTPVAVAEGQSPAGTFQTTSLAPQVAFGVVRQLHEVGLPLAQAVPVVLEAGHLNLALGKLEGGDALRITLPDLANIPEIGTVKPIVGGLVATHKDLEALEAAKKTLEGLVGDDSADAAAKVVAEKAVANAERNLERDKIDFLRVLSMRITTPAELVLRRAKEQGSPLYELLRHTYGPLIDSLNDMRAQLEAPTRGFIARRKIGRAWEALNDQLTCTPVSQFAGFNDNFYDVVVSFGGVTLNTSDSIDEFNRLMLAVLGVPGLARSANATIQKIGAEAQVRATEYQELRVLNAGHMGNINRFISDVLGPTISEHADADKVIAVFGAGGMNYISLKILAEKFKEVVLIDIADLDMDMAIGSLPPELRKKVTSRVRDLSLIGDYFMSDHTLKGKLRRAIGKTAPGRVEQIINKSKDADTAYTEIIKLFTDQSLFDQLARETLDMPDAEFDITISDLVMHELVASITNQVLALGSAKFHEAWTKKFDLAGYSIPGGVSSGDTADKAQLLGWGDVCNTLSRKVMQKYVHEQARVSAETAIFVVPETVEIPLAKDSLGTNNLLPT
ncbi:MAG: hypothetical protein COV71_00650, partial [Candidatus Omnitrophica bacterium CG11_big_fil_rev_8_21_14_0_20_41_12]